MEKKNDIEDIINKIDKEISVVKNHVSDATYNLSIGNSEEAVKHLLKAKEISTCSYCQQKLNYFIETAKYSSSLCNINYKTCEDTKQNIIKEMSLFTEKLPSISDIRKNKATNPSSPQNIDPVAEIWKSYDMMMQSFGKLVEGVFKW